MGMRLMLRINGSCFEVLPAFTNRDWCRCSWMIQIWYLHHLLHLLWLRLLQFHSPNRALVRGGLTGHKFVDCLPLHPRLQLVSINIATPLTILVRWFSVGENELTPHSRNALIRFCWKDTHASLPKSMTPSSKSI
jgi:hypothetical protein